MNENTKVMVKVNEPDCVQCAEISYYDWLALIKNEIDKNVTCIGLKRGDGIQFELKLYKIGENLYTDCDEIYERYYKPEFDIIEDNETTRKFTLISPIRRKR